MNSVKSGYWRVGKYMARIRWKVVFAVLHHFMWHVNDGNRFLSTLDVPLQEYCVSAAAFNVQHACITGGGREYLQDFHRSSLEFIWKK
jgi:hypothetical protein